MYLGEPASPCYPIPKEKDMKIRIKQIRNGGSEITFGPNHERRYHFKPETPNRPDENHVCEVTHDGDLAAMLGNPNSFEIHKGAAQAAAQAAAAGTAGAAAPAAPAAGDAGKGADDGKAGDTGKAFDIDTADKAALIAYIVSKGGKKPHPSTSIEKLRAAAKA